MGGAVLFGLAWLCLRNPVKAAILASIFNVLFYAYGWVFEFLIQHEPFRWSYTAWHRVLLVGSYTIVITLGVLLHSSRRHFRTLSRFLSSTLVILLAMFAVKIVHHHVRIALSGQKAHLPQDVATKIARGERPRRSTVNRKAHPMCTTSF